MKRINIGLPDDLHTNAKAMAALKGITMGNYLLEALNQAVERDKHLLDKLKRTK